MHNKTRKLIYISMLVTQAMILSYIESLLPAIPIQGAKLGLANIITILALSTLDLKSTFFIVIARTTLSAFMFGNMASLLYSMSGGVLSFILMAIIYNLFKQEISLISVSIAGAIFHNIGQLITAIFVLQNTRLTLLLPYLLLIAIPTGLFVGMVSKYLLVYLKNSNFNYKE